MNALRGRTGTGTGAGTGSGPVPAPRPGESAAPLVVETDPEAAVGLTTLFELHYAQLVRLARHLLDDPGDAEDVVMDAFAGLERRWQHVKRPDDAFFYLRSSVVNGTRSRLRRLRVARARLHTQLDRDSAPADQAAMLHLEHEAVVVALRRLPRRQREVLVLRYYTGASEQEIAEVLGISTGAVKTHASRGLHGVAASLEDGS